MTLIDYIRSNDVSGLTEAQIVAAYSSDAQNFEIVTIAATIAWLAGGGRAIKMETAAAIDPAAYVAANADALAALGVPAPAQLDVVTEFVGAVKAFNFGLPNATTSIDMTPGGEQRQFFDFAAAIGVLTAGDVAELVSRARPAGWVEAAEADVPAALALVAAIDARDIADLAVEAAAALARAINAVSVDDATVSPVTLTPPAVPTGYSWVSGQLTKDA